MAEQTLRANLEILRQQLADSSELDDDLRRELASVAATIERVLDEPAPDYRAAHASLEGRALQFEASHPAFSRILSEVTDALAKLGL